MPRVYASKLLSLRSWASWCCLIPRVGDARGSKTSVIKGGGSTEPTPAMRLFSQSSLFCVCLKGFLLSGLLHDAETVRSPQRNMFPHVITLLVSLQFYLHLFFFVLLQLAHNSNHETICMCLLRKVRNWDQKMRRTGCYVVVDQLITFVQLPNGRKPPCFDSRKPSTSEMW